MAESPIIDSVLRSSLSDYFHTQQSPQMLGALGMENLTLVNMPISSSIGNLAHTLGTTTEDLQASVPTPPALDKIELDSGRISFRNGVPVGGQSHLSLFPNGAYNFSGHFHDAGAPSYDVSFVWLVKSNTGTVFTFAHTGRVHGTFEAGSRNEDWGLSGTNPALAAAWNDISIQGYTWSWRAAANFDLGQLINTAVQGLGQVASVIAIVG